jgi:hypothetical protein
MTAPTNSPFWTAPDSCECHGVGISDDTVWQVEGDAITAHASREQIRRCAIGHGSPESNPRTLALLGLVLMSPGLIVLSHVLDAFAGADFEPKHGFDAVLLLFVALGAWLFVRAALIRRHYLLVVTATQSHRYAFGRRATAGEIARFVETARNLWGWELEPRKGRPAADSAADRKMV